MAKYKTGRYQSWGKTSKAFSYALREAGYAANEATKEQMTLLAEDFLSDLDAKWPHHSEGRSYFDGAIKVLNGSKFGGSHDYPWYSGQLHDSTAIRLAQGNRLIAERYMPASAYPPPGEPGRFLLPDGSQTMSGFPGGINGAEMAKTGVSNAARYSHFLSPGIQVQLVVGVPYADMLNQSGRHKSFFDSIADDLVVFYDHYDWNGYFNKYEIISDGDTVKVKTKNRGIRKR